MFLQNKGQQKTPFKGVQCWSLQLLFEGSSKNGCTGALFPGSNPRSYLRESIRGKNLPASQSSGFY